MTARRTRCPEGRPLHRIGEIPAHLATVTMLKRMRRRPAAGQDPAATLFYHGNRYAPLYEIEAAESMPDLTGKRAEAFTLARTCSRCAATGSEPFHRADRKRRLCPNCTTAERYAKVRPSWLAGRWEAVAWARDVLADPRTALVHQAGDRWSGFPQDLYAATLGGQVLIDVTIWPERPTARCQSRPDGSVLAVDVAEQIHALAARRIIAWETGPLELVRHELNFSGAKKVEIGSGVYRYERNRDLDDWPALPWSAGAVANGDRFGGPFGGRYSVWRHDPLPGHIWSGPDGLTTHRPTGGGNARQAVEEMATLLRLMAADDHPDGPPLCPVLPPAGVIACGAPAGWTGRCAGHARAVEEGRDG